MKLLCALLLLFVVAQQVCGDEGDFRRTPFGHVHKDCLKEVPSGSVIEETLIDGVAHAHVVYPDGSSELHPKCAHAVTREKRADPPTWNGWPYHYWYGPNYAYFTNPPLSSPVTFFQAQWNVPNYPEIRRGNSSAPWTSQPTLSWWIGIQPSNFGDVLQPVLEFNGLIANDYDISSWNCCPAGYTFHSTAIRVSPGQVIQGTLDLVSAPYSYTIETAVVKGASTNLTANMASNKPIFTWAEVINEGYFVTDCKQLPANNVTFVINEFTTQAGSQNVNTIPWKVDYTCDGATCPETYALSPSCVFKTTQRDNILTIQA